jgi:hypothetical protein
VRIFDSPEAALSFYEKYQIGKASTSLDFSPPYTFVEKLMIGRNCIVIYKYAEGGDSSVAFLFLKEMGNKWRIIDGFCWLEVNTSSNRYWQPGSYNYENVKIGWRKYAICFSWLPIDSDQDIYVDGVKSIKTRITIPTKEGSYQVNLCYALSVKTNNLISNVGTDIGNRHLSEIKWRGLKIK